MRLIIRDDAKHVGVYIAEYMSKRIRDCAPTAERPFVLGLSTGSSPIPVYKHLIELHKKQGLSFKNVSTFNMNEYVDLPENHPESYHTFMFREFFAHVDIDPQNVHILNGNLPDLIGECKAYEQAIKDASGIELFLAGIGSSLTSRTHIKTLTYDTILANACFFNNDNSKVPEMTLTVGVQTVMDAREVVVVVTRLRKALALSKAIGESESSGLQWTLSCLRLHLWALIVADKDATNELHVKTVKYSKSIKKVQEEVQKKHEELNKNWEGRLGNSW